MNVIGIICEYNPFHYGHLYHIKKIKEQFPDSIIVLVLNGYFLERGEISVQTKEEKTKLALDFGVHIVLELPVLFGTQSADIFAEKSILLLHQMGVTDLVFGSETNDPSLFLKIAQVELSNPNYQSEVKQFLSEGLNYPTALSKSLHLKESLDQPNDLLGISYAKAIVKNQFDMTIHTILRTNSYHDTKSYEAIVSASNIRKKWKNQEDITKYLPEQSITFLHSFDQQKYFDFLKYRILTEDHLEQFLDVTEGIENRILKYIVESNSLEELIFKVKTKRYTFNRMNRMFLHIALGILKKDASCDNDYFRILGFDQKGQEYIKSRRKSFTLPTMINYNSILWKYEKRAAYFYEVLTNQAVLNFEIQNKPLMKKEN